VKKIIFISVFYFLAMANVFATHNRAGEITYRRIFDANNPNSFKYEATVVTYTRLPANQIPDRCELEILWGDGAVDTIQRTNGVSISSCPHAGEQVAADIKKNIYIGTHTYAGASCFTISVTDPNRNASVINIPNSTNVAFYIETKLCINPFLGFNNTSPVLLNPPIDNACACKKFVHNPGAFDSDGDSLSYELIDCKDIGGVSIFGYTLPPGVTINATNGDMIWQCPTPIGEFNFAILIKEWRQGSLIGSVERDLQVTVVAGCQNDPPVIANLNDTCVVAGSSISFAVKATDPNVNNKVTLTSTGGVYLLSSSPAIFPQGINNFTTVTGQFVWNTNCSHVRLQPYQVLFKAEDDNLSTPLVDIKTVNIQVIAPAPQNLTAIPTGTAIKLNWQQEICSDATGYKIYRKNSPSGFVPGNCITGIPASTGYVQIASVNGIATTTFTDNDNGNGLINGLDYCYMIYAVFADGSKSYASNEFCVKLKKDAPIITNVDVLKTGTTNGKIYVAWSKPTQLDTLIPGPFYYFIHRSIGLGSGAFQLIDSTDAVGGLNDTTYIDTALNTQANGYTYRIDLYTKFNRTFISDSRKASSVFLSLTPNDNQLQLTWNYNVPWTDSLFVIYKQSVVFPFDYDSIGNTAQNTFTDTGLINGKNYCYKVKEYGKYGSYGLIYPIINNSQEACDKPVDLTPPCAPGNFKIAANCDLIQNTLSWNNPNDSCSDDVVGYKIFYAPVLEEELQFIKQLNDPNEISFTHNSNSNSIAGCYAVAAVDSFGNVGPLSDSVCIDNCPNYELPNIITVDGDGSNDFFVPFPYKFVESIDLTIYNRWGQTVFKTNDPAIGWDGKNKDSKLLVPDGVYYYVCDVNEIRLTGIETRTIKGFIHVFTSAKKSNNN
jgi:gliding motility-associated-like protein